MCEKCTFCMCVQNVLFVGDHVTAWLPHVPLVHAHTYCISAVRCVFACDTDTQLCGLFVFEMFMLVVLVVLSVSFCLSDGCEGQSLLAVSQNGLSLSLASLFSGICRLDGWARLLSYIDCLLRWHSFWEEADGFSPNWEIWILILSPKLDSMQTKTFPIQFSAYFFIFIKLH